MELKNQWRRMAEVLTGGFVDYRPPLKSLENQDIDEPKSAKVEREIEVVLDLAPILVERRRSTLH